MVATMVAWTIFYSYIYVNFLEPIFFWNIDQNRNTFKTGFVFLQFSGSFGGLISTQVI